MKKLSINQLHELTDRDRRTIKKYLHGIEPDQKGRYDSTQALGILYNGQDEPSYSEAIRRMTVARTSVLKEQETKLSIENDLTLKRVIPAERVLSFLENVFIAIKSKITSSHLSSAEQNAILLDLASLKDADL
jgi:hypothetical protein